MDSSEPEFGDTDLLHIERWVIACDPGATRRAYADIRRGAPEQCGCDTCRNFAAARRLVYSPAVRGVLDQLGIDHRKEAEVYHNGLLDHGLHYYGGWFHFVGSIESGAGVMEPAGTFRPEPGNDGFEMGFSRSLALVPEAFGNRPLVQLEFWAKVP